MKGLRGLVLRLSFIRVGAFHFQNTLSSLPPSDNGKNDWRPGFSYPLVFTPQHGPEHEKAEGPRGNRYRKPEGGWRIIGRIEPCYGKDTRGGGHRVLWGASEAWGGPDPGLRAAAPTRWGPRQGPSSGLLVSPGRQRYSDYQ